MERAVKLALGATTLMAVGGRMLWHANRAVKVTLCNNKRYIRNFIRFNLGNDHHFLALVAELSPRQTHYLATLIAKTCENSEHRAHCELSAFQQAIQD